LGFWLYYGCKDFPRFLQAQGQGKELTRKFEFQDRFDILLEKRSSGVAKLVHTKLYWKYQFGYNGFSNASVAILNRQQLVFYDSFGGKKCSLKIGAVETIMIIHQNANNPLAANF
jgi:hypothetical protein